MKFIKQFENIIYQFLWEIIFRMYVYHFLLSYVFSLLQVLWVFWHVRLCMSDSKIICRTDGSVALSQWFLWHITKRCDRKIIKEQFPPHLYVFYLWIQVSTRQYQEKDEKKVKLSIMQQQLINIAFFFLSPTKEIFFLIGL